LGIQQKRLRANQLGVFFYGWAETSRESLIAGIRSAADLM